MRAGPLSNVQVVALLNRYFVPVYTSNEDYRGDGPAPAAERKEYERIYRQALQAKLSTGTVHAYILTPDGQPIDSLHVAEAAKVEKLIDMLERNRQKLHVTGGEPVLKPAAQSAAPKCDADCLVLQIVARYLTPRGKELVPLGDEARLGETRNASWSALPAENWIVLSAGDAKKLLPGDAVAVGTTWEIDAAVSAKFLHHFYPPTENNDVATNRIDEQTLKGRIVSVADGVARARLDGRLKMKHPFYHRPDDNVVDATLVGFVDFDVASRTVRSLQLVTEQAAFGRQAFGVALRTAH